MNIWSRFKQKTWSKWLDKRIPPAAKVKLHRHNIFILPSRFGAYYCLGAIALFLLGTNYQNNLIILLSMLLISIFASTMLLCYQNLAGLSLQANNQGESFAEQPLKVSCLLDAEKPKYGIELNYENEEHTVIQQVAGQQYCALRLGAKARGQYQLDRITVASVFPLGLFRAWSHIDLNQQVIVYPNPLSYKQVALIAANDEQGKRHALTQTGDHFSGLDSYHLGESLKRVAWKQVAQGKGMLTKQFEQTIGEPNWLDYDQIVAKDKEEKLSYLSYLTIELSKKNQPFGLVLPHSRVAVNRGETQRQRVLTTLALVRADHE
ncbi:DUF58 domain-containing protein [Psychrobium sp. 1_MG-2023]|uniref:DUF58 domain-containing protein n=1 Tax=Psychrobium sp. 1_MG-2023 TaxID=3062624 RepID=UPI000C324F9C|nr:DUF58 domain-containing protein [Psychrobium sp. 1_MG-2023]MDP2561092.1 DUF58 domain-containing protein [Psychrobium sp. 1_MG-2023]PKF58381.1 DUF58 domain-containing protein [Alteromonadales bacterium alter-6D02]